MTQRTKIGIPREVKPQEARVGLIPAAVSELTRKGHVVFVEHNAGLLSGYADEDYKAAGARIAADADALYASAQMIVKVKEPWGDELQRLRGDHLLFSYLHLAPNPELTRRLLEIGLTAIGFETVDELGHLPLLAPMSDIAGRIAVHAGVQHLQHPQQGRGVLLGGVAGATRGKVVVLGGGVAGMAAAEVAAALGAEVTIFEKRYDKMPALRALGANVTPLYPHADELQEAVRTADLLIGAVLIPGARAPHLVSESDVQRMQAGSVIVDISVDQGGCIETTRPTTWDAPVFVEHGVLHFGVTNMPGAVPRTASQALSAVLTPYVERLAHVDWLKSAALRDGINVADGKIVHPALQNMSQDL